MRMRMTRAGVKREGKNLKKNPKRKKFSQLQPVNNRS